MIDQPRNLRPTPPPLPDPTTLPPELTALSWVAVDPQKIPHNPKTGRRADPTDPTTGGTLAQALAFARRHPGWMVGVILTETAGIVAVDLDHCITETGNLTPAAQEIIDQLPPTYVEPSASGTGLHLYCLGTLPPGRRKRAGIEMYSGDRYVIVTGQPIDDRTQLIDCTDALADLHRDIFPPAPTPRPIAPAQPLSLDTEELRRSCEGSAKFRRLFAGDMSDYPDGSADGADQSAAELAFCDLIVRNGGTPAQADELYRSSGLCRPKWDTRRGQQTYGEWTIAKAFDGTVRPFERRTRGPKPQDAADLPITLAATGTDDALPDDVPTLKAMIVALTRRVEIAEQRTKRAEDRAAEAARRVEMLSRVQSRTVGILRNKKLGQERFTATALTNLFAHRESAGLHLEHEQDDGLYKMPLSKIAEAAGISDDTAGKHVKKLEAEGVLRRDVRWVPEEWVHPETGELMKGRNRQFVGPVGNVIDFVEAVAQLAPEKEKNWGGLRRCTEHPTADVIRTTTWTCAECGEELRTVHSKPYRPKPQDAADPPTTDELLIAEDTAAERGDSIPQRGTSFKGRSGTTCYNEMPAADGTVASAWLNAQPFPGMGPPGPDRWGTEPHAGAAP